METQSERLAAIEKKEAELNAREAELRKNEIDLDYDNKKPNFPPLIHLIYHNITEEIPIAKQAFVRTAFIAFIVFVVSLLLNIISCCTVGTMENSSVSLGYNIVFSVIYLALGTVLCFQLNYFRLYTMAKSNDIGVSWIIFQVALVLFCAYLAVGFNDSGSVGVITMIDMFSKSTSSFAKVLAIITSVVLLGSAVFEVFVMIRGFTVFKSSAVPSRSFGI